MIIRQNNTRTNHIGGKISKCNLKYGKNGKVKHHPTSIRLFLMCGTQHFLSHCLFLSKIPSFSSHLSNFPVHSHRIWVVSPVLASLERVGILSVLPRGVLFALSSSHLSGFSVLAPLGRVGIHSVLPRGVLFALRLPIPSSLSFYLVASGAFSLSASFSSRATLSPRVRSELSELP